MKLVLDRLPPKALEIADLIGMDAMLMLVKKRGGQCFFPNRSGPEFDALAADIGEQAAGILANHYREYLSVPLCHHAIRAAMREYVRHEFDRLTKEEGMSGRQAIREMTCKPPHGYTEHTLWKILKKIENGDVSDIEPARNTKQTELF